MRRTGASAARSAEGRAGEARRRNPHDRDIRVKAQGRPVRSRRSAPLATPEDLRLHPYLVNRLSNRLTIDQSGMLGERGLTNGAAHSVGAVHLPASYGQRNFGSRRPGTIDRQSHDRFHAGAGLVTRERREGSRRREVATTEMARSCWRGLAGCRAQICATDRRHSGQKRSRPARASCRA